MKLTFVIDKEYDIRFAKLFNKDIDYLENFYKESMPYLEKTIGLYQNSWDRINDDFSEYIKTNTGYDWYYSEYQCIVSPVNQGISNWGESSKIIRCWWENPFWMRKITAHELILSHYFEIYKHNFHQEGLKDNQIWALAEISAFALTSLRPEVINFWPWNTSYNTNHNYPQIVELQKQLKGVFIKSKDFDEYIKIGIELVKKYPDIKP